MTFDHDFIPPVTHRDWLQLSGGTADDYYVIAEKLSPGVFRFEAHSTYAVAGNHVTALPDMLAYAGFSPPFVYEGPYLVVEV